MVYSRNFSLQWKRASSFATTILFLCFSVATLQAETTTIRVVRDSSKKEAKSIKKVISTVEQLLTSANRPMKQYLDDYQSYSRQSYEVDKVRYTLTTNLKEAEQVNKQDTEDLQDALFEKFALETNNLFLPNTLA
ncbi:MAG: hypothetical protein KDD62_09265, partial [Bdellovibrionales bacterium]|nr:hypothetical protein [Bdellovibrionales bacterium]